MPKCVRHLQLSRLELHNLNVRTPSGLSQIFRTVNRQQLPPTKLCRPSLVLFPKWQDQVRFALRKRRIGTNYIPRINKLRFTFPTERSLLIDRVHLMLRNAHAEKCPTDPLYQGSKKQNVGELCLSDVQNSTDWLSN